MQSIQFVEFSQEEFPNSFGQRGQVIYSIPKENPDVLMADMRALPDIANGGIRGMGFKLPTAALCKCTKIAAIAISTMDCPEYRLQPKRLEI